MSTQATRDPRAQLGEELHALLRDHAAAADAIIPLAGAAYPGHLPRAFRVHCVDGRTLKLVRAAGPRQAALVERISRHLDPHAFSPVLACAGAALLTPWVDGAPLHTAGWSAADVRGAGELLAALHRTAPPRGATPVEDVRVAGYFSRLAAHLRALARHALISPVEQQVWLDAARAHAPAVAATGIIHRDICAENLVRRRGGDLCVIDIETLTLGAYDYDLARTWYRWPLDAAQRAVFRHAYGATAAAATPPSFPFWAICALASSAQLRRRNHADAAAAPLHRLRGLIDALRAGADGAQLAWQP